ncbi:MAG: hypothetical protein GY930_01425, partial [bacterium]|nr:hypothetical protein [bacterium]
MKTLLALIFILFAGFALVPAAQTCVFVEATTARSGTDSERKLIKNAYEDLTAEWSEPDTCGGCSEDEGGATLCEKHADRMARQADAIWKDWAGASESTKAYRILSMGKMAREHFNASAPQLLDVLTRCLQTERGWHVRATCAMVISRLPRPERYQEQMTSMVQSARPKLKKQGRRTDALLARKFEGVTLLDWLDSRSQPRGKTKTLERFLGALTELQTLTMDSAKQSLQLRMAVLALGDVPGPEVVGVLRTVMKDELDKDARSTIMKVAEALHSPELWHATILRLKIVERPFRKIMKGGQKMMDRPLPKQPKRWKGSADDWRKRAERERMTEIPKVLKKAEPLLRELRLLDEGLRTYAKHLGTPAPEVEESEFFEAWNVWEKGLEK